jgi:hypothetical protein
MHRLLQKEGKKLKRFELSPPLSLKKLGTIFFLAKEPKTKNPFKYTPSKPYKKKS